MIAQQRFDFDLPIWRVMADTFAETATRQLLAIELRSQTKVEWCVVDTQTSQKLWQHHLPNASWWTSLIGFYAGTLLFHTYTSQEQPMPKELLAVDAFSGTINWSLKDCKFESTDGKIVRILRTDRPLLQQFNFCLLQNGQATSADIFSEIAIPADWRCPILHQTSSPYFATLSQFIEEKTGKMPQKAIKYGEITNHILFFQYLYPTNANTLSHFILVVNSSKIVLWHELIDSNINTELFAGCLYNDRCIVYLNHLSELVVLNLSLP
ncbi:MAG: DUF4905 domain-containing protein [Spirosomataceae bacterium]